MTNRPIRQTSASRDVGLSGIRIPAMPEKVQSPSDSRKRSGKIPVPELPGDGTFHDLRISALLKERCFVTQNGLVRVQLELSEHPPLGWSYIFLNVWQEIDEPTKPRVEIEEDTLWVETEATEFKSRDFPLVQKAIEETNARFRKVLQEQIEAEARREQLDRETLETILGLELDLAPRAQPKRKNRWLRAYLNPLAWGAFAVCWVAAGIWGWQTIPASEWSFIREPMLVIVWSWILYGAAGWAISQFKQRYRIRKFVLRKRQATLWPAQYVDRKGRDDR